MIDEKRCRQISFININKLLLLSEIHIDNNNKKTYKNESTKKHK